MKVNKSFVKGTGAGLLGVLAMLSAGQAAQAAQVECYDFNNLAVGTEYHVGDAVNARYADVHLKEFHVAPHTPSQSAVQFASVTNGQIALGAAPELRMYLINAQVTPIAPVRKVSLKFAENLGSLLSNIEVNGSKHVVQGGLSSVNGMVIGDATTGWAVVTANITSAAPGVGFNRGTLELYALAGGEIQTFSIGGQQLVIDDVCMTKL